PGKSSSRYTAGDRIILRGRVTNGRTGGAGNGRCRINGNSIIECRPRASVGSRGDHVSNRHRRRGCIHQTLGNGTAGLVTHRSIADTRDRRPSPGKGCSAYITGNAIVLSGRITNGGTGGAGHGRRRINGNRIRKCRPGTTVGGWGNDVSYIDRR